MSLNPYLYFNGQCEEAFTFYEKRLGGKITFIMRYEGSPMAAQAPEGFAQKILHAGLNLGDVFSYALAKVTGSQLLYKGDDFAQTDLEAALPPP